MSGCATRTASPRPLFGPDPNGQKAGQENQSGGGAGDPDATRDGRPHVVVHQHERTTVGAAATGGESSRMNVTAAGDDDDVIEDHVPDNDGPRDPQRPGEANLGPRLHMTNYRMPLG